MYKLSIKHYKLLLPEKVFKENDSENIAWSMIDMHLDNKRFVFWKARDKDGLYNLFSNVYFLATDVSDYELKIMGKDTMDKLNNNHRVSVVDIGNEWIKHYTSSHWLKMNDFRTIGDALV